MIRGRNDWPVELCNIEAIEENTDSYSFKKSDGWLMFVGKNECGDFVPQVGDWILTEQPVNNIATIIIEGRVIRHKTQADIDADFDQWKKDWRLEKLERYISHGEKLKAQVKDLHPDLQRRMERFVSEAEDETEFWIDSAGYEMICLQGATALYNAAMTQAETSINVQDSLEEAALLWIDEWNKMKYDDQMALVPDFGEGHTGNTAGAAVAMAKMLVRDEGDKL